MTDYNVNGLDNDSKKEIKSELNKLFEETATDIKKHYEQNHLFRELAYQFYKIDEKFAVVSENGYLNTTVAIENEIFEYLESKAFEYSLSELLTILLYKHSDINNDVKNPNDFVKQSNLLTNDLLIQFRSTLGSVINKREEKAKNIEKEKEIEFKNAYVLTKDDTDNQILKRTNISEKSIQKDKLSNDVNLSRSKCPIIYKNELPDFTVEHFFINIFPYIQDIFNKESKFYIGICLKDCADNNVSEKFDKKFNENNISEYKEKLIKYQFIKFPIENIKQVLEWNKELASELNTTLIFVEVNKNVKRTLKFPSNFMCIIEAIIKIYGNGKTKPKTHIKFAKTNIENYLQKNDTDNKAETTRVSTCIDYYNDEINILNKTMNEIKEKKEKLINFKYIFNKIYSNDFLSSLIDSIINKCEFLFDLNNNSVKDLFLIQINKTPILKAYTLEINKKLMNLNLLAKYNLRIDKIFGNLYSANVMEDLKNLDPYRIYQYEDAIKNFYNMLPSQIAYFENIRQIFFDNFIELYDQFMKKHAIKNNKVDYAIASKIIETLITMIVTVLSKNHEVTKDFNKLTYESSNQGYLILVYLFISGTINVCPDFYKFNFFEENHYKNRIILQPLMDLMVLQDDDYQDDDYQDDDYIDDSELEKNGDIKPLKPLKIKKDDDVSN